MTKLCRMFEVDGIMLWNSCQIGIPKHRDCHKCLTWYFLYSFSNLSSNKLVSEAPAYRYPFNLHKVDIYFKYISNRYSVKKSTSLNFSKRNIGPPPCEEYSVFMLMACLLLSRVSQNFSLVLTVQGVGTIIIISKDRYMVTMFV